MESFSELIKTRRSMRKFTEEELTQEQVVALMKAALMAPTSKRSNAWQFIVVDDKETLKKLSFCKEQASQFIADAALAVVVTADPLASDVWMKMPLSLPFTCNFRRKIWDWAVAGYSFASVLRHPACPLTNMCTKYSTCLCSCRLSVSLPSGIKEWSASLSMRTTCNGKRFTLTNMEESNGECGESK